MRSAPSALAWRTASLIWSGVACGSLAGRFARSLICLSEVEAAAREPPTIDRRPEDRRLRRHAFDRRETAVERQPRVLGNRERSFSRRDVSVIEAAVGVEVCVYVNVGVDPPGRDRQCGQVVIDAVSRRADGHNAAIGHADDDIRRAPAFCGHLARGDHARGRRPFRALACAPANRARRARPARAAGHVSLTLWLPQRSNALHRRGGSRF